MKRTASIISFAMALAVLGACNKPVPTAAAKPTEPPTAVSPDKDDVIAEYEALTRHLVGRVEEANGRINSLQNEMLKQENEYLDEEIAILQDRPVPKHDSMDSQRQMAKDLEDAAARAAQDALDSEASIELRNRIHPEAPEADLKDLLRLECGDCQKERATRNAQLKAEAAHASAKGAR